MEIKQLRYFKRVADAGSVSRAAAALSVAQPAVSRQIANLEESLGTPLFFRNGRGVKLTDAGEQLYGHTSAILDSVRDAERDVRDSVGIARGTLLIGSMPSVVRIIAPPLLKFVQKNHPALILEFTEGHSGYVNEWLSNGLLDVAIIHDATRTQHFLTDPLIREELVAVNGSGDTSPARLGEVIAEPLILPRKNHGLRLMLERTAGQIRVPLNIRYEIDSLDAIKALVRSGEGVTILPRSTVDPGAGMAVRMLSDPPLFRQLLLATSSQRPVSHTTRAIIHELKRQVRDMINTPRWPGAVRLAQQKSPEEAEPVARAVVDMGHAA
ncbi:MAG: LysR family transcriptional regulator [Pseudomonadota bacterium]